MQKAQTDLGIVLPDEKSKSDENQATKAADEKAAVEGTVVLLCFFYHFLNHLSIVSSHSGLRVGKIFWNVQRQGGVENLERQGRIFLGGRESNLSGLGKGNS